MDYFFFWWILCMVLSGVIASVKNRMIWAWVALAFFTGPLSPIILLIIPAKPRKSISLPEDSDARDLKDELTALRIQVSNLSFKIDELDKLINPPTTPETPPQPQAAVSENTSPSRLLPEVLEAVDSLKPDMELNLGRYWLSRIGIVVLTLGVGFLITYTFRSLGAWAKIIVGYAVSASLFKLGVWLERQEKFVNYGRVLLGGAWALLYFTVYAMYHFEASRVLNCQVTDLALLGLVSAGMIIHSLKYRSQELSGIALFIGYITATMGDVNYFTLSGCALLALTALVLIYRMQWLKLILPGILLTYLTHVLWVVKHIYFSRVDTGYTGVREVYFLINTSFLSLYWFLFTAGIRLIRGKNETEENMLASAEFLNCMLFFFMVLPKISWTYPAFKFPFVCFLGAIYLLLSFLEDWKKNHRLYLCDTIIAVSLGTLAIPLKFMTYHTTVIWLIELPVLLLAGLAFDKKVFRYLSTVLAALIFLKFLFHDYSSPGTVMVFNMSAGWPGILSCAGLISMSWCYYFCRAIKTASEPDNNEIFLRNIFPVSAAVYCATWLVSLVTPEWATVMLSLEIIALLATGVLFKDEVLRWCAFALSMVVSFRLVFVDQPGYFPLYTQWIIIGWILMILYAAYFVLRDTAKTIQFSVATCLLVYAVHAYTRSDWITLALGIAGLCLFTAGFLCKDRFFRIGGFIVFAVTVARVFLVDLSGLPIIYKFISFIILGILFLAVSFIYNKYAIKSEHDSNRKK